MFFKVQPAAAKGRIGAKHEHIVVALILQNIAKTCRIGKELGLGDHVIVFQIVLQRKTGCHAKHRSHRKGRIRQGIGTIQNRLGSREIFIALGNLCQLRNHIILKSAPISQIRICHFHRFQIDEDKIALLLWERNRNRIRINVIVFNECRRMRLIVQIITNGKDVPDIHIRNGQHCHRGYQADDQQFLIETLSSCMAEKLPEKNNDGSRGNTSLNDRTFDDTAARALGWCRQLVHQLIHGQILPCPQHPGRQQCCNSRKRNQQQADHMNHLPLARHFLRIFSGINLLFFFLFHCKSFTMRNDTCVHIELQNDK